MGGQQKTIVASVVIAEEEAEETAVALLVIEVVSLAVVAAEPDAGVESYHGKGGNGEPNAAPGAAQRPTAGIVTDPCAAIVREDGALELGKTMSPRGVPTTSRLKSGKRTSWFTIQALVPMMCPKLGYPRSPVVPPMLRIGGRSPEPHSPYSLVAYADLRPRRK